MHGRYCLLAAWALACTGPPSLAQLGADDWKFDVVHRTRGRAPYQGLVVMQSDAGIVVKRVFRQSGSPTVVIEERLPKADVERLELLGPREREQLVQRLENLSRERKLLAAQIQLWKGGKVELSETDALALKPVPWGKDERGGLSYESAYFKLLSNAREDVVHMTAIQLEMVFTAYVRCLPPRVAKPRPTTIVLTRSLTEYHNLLKEQGRNILNPAYFDPARNQVVCGSNLERLSHELEEIRNYHDKERARLLGRKAELQRVYNRQAPPELIKPIDDALQRIRQLDAKNATALRDSHHRLIRRLCHEACHAYLAGSVFSDESLRVPVWLDEGLAQIFEASPVEGGELRVGEADPDRLRRVRAALKAGGLVDLATLLRAAPRQFQVAHAGDTHISDRYYLTSWALAFYLTFERALLGTESLDDYLRALHRGTDPLEAFRQLTGRPLDEFEKDFHRYLLHLREDGTSAVPK